MQRGWSCVRQIEREVLAKSRRALVIYGYGHFLRRDTEMEEDNVIRRLDKLYPGKHFPVIVPFAKPGGDAIDPGDFASSETPPIYLDAQSDTIRDRPAARYIEGASGVLGEVTDGIIWYGPEPDETVRPPATLFEKDPAYKAELERRRNLRPRLGPESYR